MDAHGEGPVLTIDGEDVSLGERKWVVVDGEPAEGHGPAARRALCPGGNHPLRGILAGGGVGHGLRALTVWHGDDVRFLECRGPGRAPLRPGAEQGGGLAVATQQPLILGRAGPVRLAPVGHLGHLVDDAGVPPESGAHGCDRGGPERRGLLSGAGPGHGEMVHVREDLAPEGAVGPAADQGEGRRDGCQRAELVQDAAQPQRDAFQACPQPFVRARGSRPSCCWYRLPDYGWTRRSALPPGASRSWARSPPTRCQVPESGANRSSALGPTTVVAVSPP